MLSIKKRQREREKTERGRERERERLPESWPSIDGGREPVLRH